MLSVSSFQAGVKYQCNPKTTIRAKVNSAGVMHACAVNKCCDKVAVTVTAAVRISGRLLTPERLFLLF